MLQYSIITPSGGREGCVAAVVFRVAAVVAVHVGVLLAFCTSNQSACLWPKKVYGGSLKNRGKTREENSKATMYVRYKDIQCTMQHLQAPTTREYMIW